MGVRPGVGLTSDLKAVFYDVALAPAADVSSVIHTTVQTNIIP
jgi:hypothetical protein